MAQSTSSQTAVPTPSVAATPSVPPSPRPTPTSAPARGTALDALAGLPVKGRAPKTGYARGQFGRAWADVDRNGCDTRNDVLRRDLRGLTLKAGTNGCLVLRGTLADPYTGRAKAFVRGAGTSSAVQVDHVVALSDAWQKGAQRLDAIRRTALANDPLNLLAVDGPTNQSKGDGDAATWLPPRKAYLCSYVARQVAVKVRYGLWVTAAERDAIERVLRTCPSQTLPTAKAVPLGGGRVVATPTTTTPTPRKSTPPASRTDPRFGTCREAVAAGYGPYRSGSDPEYAWYRDRDGDGVVCE
ncbi:GmrSD restriction endonuclease domain-containing protein [Phycicoccus avicenniae]|uniref:GmrSD restriction endonuclease domain-containing protein n=1 Tax=Phycicoccus avicenniae TaxID=2828860 RepID=UPI003D2BD513